MLYNQGEGSDELCARIAALYQDAAPEQVTVTTGSAEANFISCWTLLEPGDRVAVLTPTYMQTVGLAENFGASVRAFPLHFERGWEPDPAEIASAITDDTKLVVVTNPNNPTGHVLTPASCEAILSRVRATGAWLLADEVYRGAELDGEATPSLWGRYERTLAIGGLSKAYALPGLRIGWIVSPPEFKEALLQRHDYTVICPSPASDYLARQALAVGDRLLARTRAILRENWPVLDGWLRQWGDLFAWHPPQCGAIAFARYGHPMNALELAERIRAEQDVLVVPGDHFGLARYLRFGYGNPRAELEQGLASLQPAITRLIGD